MDTPALIVDIDLMEKNLTRMRDHIAKDVGRRLRPHTKAHKCPELAKLQERYGAKGICSAKLGEAEVMADGGLKDILITTPLAGRGRSD